MGWMLGKDVHDTDALYGGCGTDTLRMDVGANTLNVVM